ncbi:PIN domain-containing protein [Desulfonema limicola]|nr:PIN domain-containing protein [Desulfonema limicola]
MTALENEKKSCFIDSNIWLYAFIDSQDLDKSIIARTIIQNNDISISTQVVNEVCINLIKKAQFPEPKIQQLIDNFYNKYTIIEFNNEIIKNASVIRQQQCFSFWDSLILSSALHSEAELLYSEDMHDGFIIESTTIVNPFTR